MASLIKVLEGDRLVCVNDKENGITEFHTEAGKTYTIMPIYFGL